MLTYFIVAIRIFSNAIANLFQKKAVKTAPSLTVNLYSYMIMSIICIVPALYVDWSRFSPEFWGYVILAGLLCTIGTVALIEALKIGEMSQLAPINSYKSVIGLFSAFVLLHEVPTLKEFVCIILIVTGSYFVLEDGKSRFSLKTFWRKDIRLRFFALFCTGIEAAILKKIIVMSDYKISLILWSFSGLLCSALCSLIKQPESKQKPNIADVFMVAVMLLIMQLSTNYVFSKLDVGISLALFQLSSLVALYFGYKVFREQNITKKLIGTVIMLVGSTLIILG